MMHGWMRHRGLLIQSWLLLDLPSFVPHAARVLGGGPPLIFARLVTLSLTSCLRQTQRELSACGITSVRWPSNLKPLVLRLNA